MHRGPGARFRVRDNAGDKMEIEKNRDVAGPQLHRGTSEQALDALRAELRAIQRSYGRLPVLDDRHADEILGYDEHGMPA